MRQLSTLTLMLLAGLYCSYSAYAMGSISTLEKIVRDFYSLFPTRCAEAVKKWQGYPIDQCQNTKHLKVLDTNIIKSNKLFVMLQVTVKYERDGIEDTDFICVKLLKEKNGWTFEPWKLQEGRCPLTAETSQAAMEESILTDADNITDQELFQNGPTHTEVTGQSLERCWENYELRGNPSERKIRKLSIPDPGTMDKNLIKYAQRHSPQTDIPGSIRDVKISNGKKPIALTFDLCERADEKSGYDAAIVNYLRDNDIKATFYASGKWMKTHKERTKQLMADPLFEIGNHAWIHGNMRVLTGQRMRNQILWTQAQYYAIRKELNDMECITESDKKRIPWVPATFRFPYGTCSPESLNTLNEFGLAAIQWNIVTGDPARGQTAQGIANIVLKEAKPGAIIIAHANGRGHGTAQSLPLFIPKLRADGYKFVTVSELLRMGTPHAVSTCYELKPGDNVRYDKIFGKGTGE